MNSLQAQHVVRSQPLSQGLLFLMASTCAVLVAALYFAQPLTSLIARDLGLRPESAGLLVTVTQLGYCAGLLLVTPLGDKVDNRRLVLSIMCCSSAALLAAALAPGARSFLVASFLVGLTSCAVQVLVPLAAHMAVTERRGQALGVMTSGLLFGILLARPVSSSLGGLAGWRSVFGCAAVITICAVGVLWHRLPSWRPAVSASYGSLVRSLWSVFATSRALRKRALSQAALFGTFTLFWTAVPWLLIAQGYTQHDIALFALAGAGGALVAPWAGRLADRGHTRKVSIGAMLLVAVAFGVAIHGSPLWLMVVAAIALDAGIQANHVVGQREVLGIQAAASSRLNSVYMGVFFAGGAAASSTAGPLFRHGWSVVAAAGALLALVALAVYLGLDAREGGRAV